MAIRTDTLPKQEVKLSKEEILRYSRHLIMPEVGLDGQLKLRQAKVLMIGTGGLGAPLGLYLAAAGVGHLGLVDFDVVDFTNLQRQVTFSTSDVGKPKTEAAKATQANVSMTATLAQTTSIGRAEVVIGNTDRAASGKLSASAAGVPDRLLWIVGIAAVAAIIVALIIFHH